MSKTVELYENGYFIGHHVQLSKILEDYPFLENENLDKATLNIWEDEIIIEHAPGIRSGTIVWKRNDMTGKWVERVTLV